MTGSSWMIGAMRTPVASRNGALSAFTAPELGSISISALIDSLNVPSDLVEHLILANGLYGGGNPARLSALASGLPENVPSMSIDTQCCGGLDSILLAHGLVASGMHDFVIAGGIESFTTAPRRFNRSLDGGPDQEYKRPPFSPWVDRDPDMLEAAAQLAKEFNILRAEQEEFAIRSHASALKAQDRLLSECIAFDDVQFDTFTRELSSKLCKRMPIIAGDVDHGITSATTCVEADASAVCAIVSSGFLSAHPKYQKTAIKILGTQSVGSDPAIPGLAPVDAVREILKKLSLTAQEFDVIEVMEAFASQAIACIRFCGFDQNIVNLGGGALARGHPIGASGAINAVRLFQEMNYRPSSKLGLAAIAGAGGLGSALVLSK
ncbi:thiolase family protein [Lentilitoribacter sp. EG35]|uniref:thiolase family protein n=1 Tax=Lentilitoribacter sp. EG35 TaxID=3234192 RepID=UPI00345F3F80